ncbi:MAG: 16S rRNA (guanine(966)-N(2))-methyltransferase RsmD [Thiotrichales bacterium]|nr:16S rRNA (guanine(966)-N(2))-methyltransferase RsmD [Thiotrichales bacterium]
MTDIAGLRPTPDRVRETVFNWLQAFVPGARCLDLFAGTGSLGFEALSRGAAEVVFVDQDRTLIDTIHTQAGVLELPQDQFRAVCKDANAWLNQQQDRFDIIFLDPPFQQGWIQRLIPGLLEHSVLVPGGLIYIECEPGLEMPGCLQTRKQKTAGAVQYGLYTIDSN